MEAEKRSIGMNLSIPLDLSIKLSRKVLDYKELGIPTTKETLLLKYTRTGLELDADGESIPVTGYDDLPDPPVTGISPIEEGTIETRKQAQ